MIRIEFLGTGTSHGIPVIGCHCPVCSSEDVHDKRYRSSILIRKGETSVVIDTGYEFRLQALRSGLDKLDAVLYTHSHSDHLMGLDDLRVFTDERKLPVYSFPSVLSSIERIFPYAFTDMPYKGVPRLERKEVAERESFSIGELEFQAIPLLHGCMRIAGYRFGSVAYFTDVSDILYEENKESFKGIKTLIIGGLRDKPHWSHFTFQQAVDNAKLIGAEEVYFTHISHATSHRDIEMRFAPYARPAYDTLVLEVDDER